MEADEPAGDAVVSASTKLESTSGVCPSVPTPARAETLIVLGNVEGSESLQDRFLRFRKERQRERALVKRAAARHLTRGSRDGEQLRKRFVETCRGYLGVPYARSKHTPEEPEYNAPLFLDCCGLVRRAVRDLEEDFGFAIGQWNQAYMFETMPQELTFEELRPGDLVFVEGTYTEEGRKPQRHNIVHVEVFIGGETGEETIGSRWARSDPAEGKVRGVQIHSSYKYISTKYEINKYHFRSLSTWLGGTCRSQSYSDASGQLASTHCGRKSIFADEGESGDEAEDNDFVPNPYGESPVFYIGEGNNWKVLADLLESRGWQRLPFEAGFSTRFDLKWVEQRAKIDYKRHIEGQMVNHIPNNDIITSKARFLHTMRAHQDLTGESFAYHPSSYTSERAGDKLAALAEADTAPEAVWVLKPSRGLGGTGIELLRGAAALRERLFPAPRDLALEPARAPKPAEGWVVQRYVESPLLVAGRKFDMRAYCLVARTTPHLWFFRPGYCKVALEPYDISDLENRFGHLTNACVQRTHPQYRERRGQHIWSEEQVEAELITSGRRTAEQESLWPGVHEQMKRALAWIFEASREGLERRAGYFDLLGVDFILDEDLRLHLLEVNSNPAMFFDSSPTLETLVPSLLGTALDMALEAQRPGNVASGAAPPAPPLFELLVDEAAGFVYGK
mmetsp:Transcript_122922/g.274484  ORF Transcript_122922/g.274484 Transcript_122922/m.274484 type:complete len:677 (-) Transcript_122922:157-2187(-)